MNNKPIYRWVESINHWCVSDRCPDAKEHWPTLAMWQRHGWTYGETNERAMKHWAALASQRAKQ